ncbi:hypothetical protein FACS189411_05310 [Bacteroidia bacterium]|nr:hypothetical protein FACS189411_05310 [Bacteroidia bacterium]
MIYYDLSARTDIINNHYNSLEKLLKKRVNDSSLNKRTKTFILNNLKQIIVGKPDELWQINNDFVAIKQRKSIKNELKKIFNYQSFVSKTGKYNAYNLAENLNIRVCLYCNRDYTLTIKKNRKGITRPEFDHFFDKDSNPLLALSIYNLVPSCHICNSTLKGTAKFDLKNHVHPYIDDCLEHYRYSYKPHDVNAVLGNTANLEIEIKTAVPKVRNTANIFELENILNGYKEEIRDLFDIRYRFSKSYLEQLFNTYKDLGVSYEEAYRIAFGVHYTEIDFEKRPFSKLKKDILKELGVVK